MNIKLKTPALLAAVALFATSASAETVLRLGHVWPDSEIHAQAAEQFAEAVSEATGGEVTVEIFGGGTLGSDREILEGLKIGTADIWIGGGGVLSAASDTAKIFTVPFMFDNLDHFAAIYDGEVGQSITEAIDEESGYQILAYWMRGPRWLTTKTRVETPEDLLGLKIRVPDSSVFVESWRQLGASPTPMNFGEVFTALQQGVIDGQENPLSLIYASKFSEVVDFLGDTQHVMEPIAVVASSSRLSQLGEEEQAAILEAANGVAKSFVAESVRSGEANFLQKLQDEGMELVEVDKEAFRSTLDGFVDTHFPSLGDVYGEIRNAAE